MALTGRKRVDVRVVIVGAGPAGLTSALYLIKEGVSPLILDKESAIRSTACGEACGVESLSRIPFDSEPYICKYLKGGKLIYPDNTCSYHYKSSVTLDRTNWLRGMAQEIEARGGQIKLNSEVVEIREDHVLLRNRERIDYDILIGADGPTSRIARHIGVKHQFAPACQYKLACDTSDMDYLEFYIDRRFSPDYSWIFPKKGVINVGTEGDFAKLDAFLAHKGLSSYKVIEKEAGILPTSGIQRLAWRNIALIGDAAAITNPLSGSGLTPIIYASEILARHITNLEDYEKEIKKHPMCSPVLFKARQRLLKLGGSDVVGLLRFLSGAPHKKVKSPSISGFVKNLSLLTKPGTLIDTYRAIRISKTYGW